MTAPANAPATGLYERLIDIELGEVLAAHPELKPILGQLDDEEAPEAYGQFVQQLLAHCLRSVPREQRLALVNRLIELLAATDGLDYLRRRALVDRKDPVLLSLQPAAPRGGETPELPRPATPLSFSSLLTGARADPSLEHELRREMATADRVDILIAFVKWTGLRLLQPAFLELAARQVPVRIVTTSYMGASDADAVGWLASQPNCSVKVSYDTERTRLHAKAYHFVRATGYSTAYIGSANMSAAAMTSGLEWTVKVTQVDQPHILDRFAAEFSSYWQSHEFELYDAERLRNALKHARTSASTSPRRFFADLRPHEFQERILEALQAARAAGRHRNLIIAATGTGKTVIAAFDYLRYCEREAALSLEARAWDRPTLLFVAHRREILEQAQDCFRAVLRDQNFGELLVDGNRPSAWRHVFASVQSLTTAAPWRMYSPERFQFIIVDEVHHGAADSYRDIFESCRPQELLGLTATPERMDGKSLLPDFGGEFTAEIRLPEALEKKLLCPFHYFGVTDPVSLAEERFWRNGQYDVAAVSRLYTGDDLRARQRVDAVIDALHRYQPNLSNVRAVGFCVSVEHAEYMAAAFTSAGLNAATIVSDTPSDHRTRLVQRFRTGELQFVFTRDVFNEGVDVPEINLVMFLRPTNSLTVFLQQLGRGLRHHPAKECLTVLDFIGQHHRRYRIERHFSALLRSDRLRIDREVEQDFPNLPPGCNIQLERVAREYVLKSIRENLRNFRELVIQSAATFVQDHQLPLTFANFVARTGISPIALLRDRTWSEWKALAERRPPPQDPDLGECRRTLRRVTLRTDPNALSRLADFAAAEDASDYVATLNASERLMLHYILWNKPGNEMGSSTVEMSLSQWHRNVASNNDLLEVVHWRQGKADYPTRPVEVAFPCSLQLHAMYSSAEAKAALGLATFETPGPTGVGVLHAKAVRCYVHLVTFRKTAKDFSPTTQYRDYPISRTQLHWESQSATTQSSPTGQNYLHFQERGYTILFFARLEKRIDDETAPFVFLGPAQKLLSARGDRPIAMVWELKHPMPAALFEAATVL